jgi:hypothetical protein
LNLIGLLEIDTALHQEVPIAFVVAQSFLAADIISVFESIYKVLQLFRDQSWARTSETERPLLKSRTGRLEEQSLQVFTTFSDWNF